MGTQGSSAEQTQVDPTREPRPQGEAGDGRRRSRDRYGRDRRERSDQDGSAAPETPEALDSGAPTAAPAETTDDAPRRPRYPTGFVSDDARAAAGSPGDNAPSVTAPTAPTANAARAGLPRVQGFTLPLDQLQQVAESSGLQWVNSDADKVAAVQAAIAAEPPPVRAPRERPAPMEIEEGPLVLVETRRDLSQVKLPFETPTAT